jgi:hypothetical protein
MSGNQDQKVNKNSLRQNTIFNQLKICIWGIPIVLLVSCTNAKQDTQSTQNPGENNNTSVIKVLNRVTCKDVNGDCPQKRINRIWQSCINAGYVTSLPTKQIASSREIKELIRDSYSVSINTPKQNTDENGIVYGSENEVVATQQEISFAGYCIGSEYITK